jgi:hypothetical protein
LGKSKLPFSEKEYIIGADSRETHMIFDIKYDSDQECIFVTFNGRISMSLVREYIAALLPVLEETDCRRLLSDCLNAEVHLSSSDIMQFPKMAAESPLIARLKRAVVATPGTSGYELYEILSKVMGQELRVFKSREVAMEWLMDESGDLKGDDP